MATPSSATTVAALRSRLAAVKAEMAQSPRLARAARQIHEESAVSARHASGSASPGALRTLRFGSRSPSPSRSAARHAGLDPPSPRQSAAAAVLQIETLLAEERSARHDAELQLRDAQREVEALRGRLGVSESARGEMQTELEALLADRERSEGANASLLRQLRALEERVATLVLENEELRTPSATSAAKVLVDIACGPDIPPARDASDDTAVEKDALLAELRATIERNNETMAATLAQIHQRLPPVPRSMPGSRSSSVQGHLYSPLMPAVVQRPHC